MALPSSRGLGECQIVAHQPGLGRGASGHALEPATIPSRWSELRASAAEKVSRFPIMLRRGWRSRPRFR